MCGVEGATAQSNLITGKVSNCLRCPQLQFQSTGRLSAALFHDAHRTHLSFLRVCRSSLGKPHTKHAMSDLTVTVAPVTSLERAKDSTNAPSKEQTNAVNPSRHVIASEDKKFKPTSATDLNYSIDHEDHALHLKVQRANGEVVREVVFDRIDPSLLDVKKLKGVFVDGNS